MDILMQLEKENGDLFFQPSKLNQGSFAGPSKELHMKKLNGFNTAKVKATRKALGDVNHVKDGNSTKAKQKNKPVHPKINKTYPDIETFIPYDPLDFETFDVPEEHRLSDRCLVGVSLFISSADAKRFAALIHPILSPMENDPMSCNAHEMFSPMFEDLTIDFPLAFDL